MQTPIPHTAEELFSNAHGAVYQCDVSNKIYVSFAGNVTAFKVNNFIKFKQMVDSVNIHTMIFNLSDEYDYEVVDTPHAANKYVLTLCELIHLRELLAGARFALYVNTTLHTLLTQPV
jgi:Mrp family chromosome partitioning ATPase